VCPCSHKPPASFRHGQQVDLALSVEGKVSAAVLHYRHVNQAERFVSAEMDGANAGYRAAIPARYTESPYPLEYYFEVHTGAGASIYPGFAPERNNQPYFVLRGSA
jgi:hypothetical protein